jgi:hypothetical protein
MSDSLSKKNFFIIADNIMENFIIVTKTYVFVEANLKI